MILTLLFLSFQVITMESNCCNDSILDFDFNVACFDLQALGNETVRKLLSNNSGLNESNVTFSTNQQDILFENNSKICDLDFLQPIFTNGSQNQVKRIQDNKSNVVASIDLSSHSPLAGPLMQIETGVVKETDSVVPLSSKAFECSIADSLYNEKIEISKKTSKKKYTYQRNTPYKDKVEERKRLNAIKSKLHRDKKKDQEGKMRIEIFLLREANSFLTQENVRLRQELMEKQQPMNQGKQVEDDRARQELIQEIQKLQDQNEMQQQLLKLLCVDV